MIVKAVEDTKELKAFYSVPSMVYEGNLNHRATEETLTHLLVDGPTVFHTHADVRPYLLWDNGRVVGRCALIHDRNLPDYVQVAFFEALPGLSGVKEALISAAQEIRSSASKLLVGMNGHLNYGAGILLNRFDEPPIFGLPYTPDYYPSYFHGLFCRESVTFRFPLKGMFEWARKTAGTFDTRGIKVRFLNKKKLRDEMMLYTTIDNTSFSNTTYWYWSNRDPQENFELFRPFRFLMKEQDLLFAEKDGKPVGFLLWYPDFNGLVPAGRDLNVLDLIRFRAANPIHAVRLAEVAVMPEYRRLPVMATILLKSLPSVERSGYEICEGGFIFRENKSSIVMTQRYIERNLGHKLDPHRLYGMYEGEL